jgi:hypothetical protein
MGPVPFDGLFSLPGTVFTPRGGVVRPTPYMRVEIVSTLGCGDQFDLIEPLDSE